MKKTALELAALRANQELRIVITEADAIRLSPNNLLTL
jgi:hypothetical protein